MSYYRTETMAARNLVMSVVGTEDGSPYKLPIRGCITTKTQIKGRITQTEIKGVIN